MRRHAKQDVHQVDLRQDSNRPLSVRVLLPRELQTIRVRQIRVGRGDGKDDGSGTLDVGVNHGTDLTLDVAGLVADGDLGETGKIDEGESDDVRRVNGQVDGLRRNSCVDRTRSSALLRSRGSKEARGGGRTGVLARQALRVPHDLVSNLREVMELLVLEMAEDSVLVRVVLVKLLGSSSLLAVGDRCGRTVDELQDLRVEKAIAR